MKHVIPVISIHRNDGTGLTRHAFYIKNVGGEGEAHASGWIDSHPMDHIYRDEIVMYDTVHDYLDDRRLKARASALKKLTKEEIEALGL